MEIRVEAFSKSYGEQKAVDQLSFQASTGEVLGFLGPNGAGKSTTMKAITGYLQPSSGRIRVGEFDVAKEPLEVRRQVGYLPEHNPLYLDMYVREFLDFIGKTHGLSKGERQRRISEVIEATGLKREMHKRIGALSKGYRQRVGLCQAILHDPPVLILDEPTSGLDPNQMADIRSLIKELGKNKTVIFSSHILSEVEAIADRAIIINRGKLVADSGEAGIDALRPSDARIFLRVALEGMSNATWENNSILSLQDSHSATSWTFTTSDPEKAAIFLFRQCSDHNNPILELRPQAQRLEDVFRDLTR